MESYYVNKTKKMVYEFNSQFKVFPGESISPNLDFKINCIDDKVVYCHKKILMKCSKFFKNMEESINNLHEINWNDGEMKYEFDTVCTLLKLLYGEEYKNIDFIFHPGGNLDSTNISQHINLLIIMDMLDLEKSMENTIFNKILDARINFSIVDVYLTRRNITVEFNTTVFNELNQNQLISVRGLSLKSIIKLPIYEKQYLSNRYIRMLKHKVLGMAINNYCEKVIYEHLYICNKNIKKSKLLVDNLLECEDILEDVKDDIRVTMDIFTRFM